MNNILLQIDQQLFTNSIPECRNIYRKIKRKHQYYFVYKCFSYTLILNFTELHAGKNNCMPLPSNLIKELEPYINKYNVILKDREKIRSYLIRAFNETTYLSFVWSLLPSSINILNYQTPLEYVHTHELYSQEPEFNLMRTYLCYAKMGIS